MSRCCKLRSGRDLKVVAEESLASDWQDTALSSGTSVGTVVNEGLLGVDGEGWWGASEVSNAEDAGLAALRRVESSADACSITLR